MCGHTPGPSHKSGPCEHGVWGLLGSQGEAGAERTRDQNLTVLLEAQTRAASASIYPHPIRAGFDVGDRHAVAAGCVLPSATALSPTQGAAAGSEWYLSISFSFQIYVIINGSTTH